MKSRLESEKIKALIEQLLNESYAREHDFEGMSASEIGDILLGEAALLDTADDQEMSTSFERARDQYCLLLQEMELAGLLGRMDENVGELASGTHETEFIPSDETTTPTEGKFLEIPEPLGEFSAPVAVETVTEITKIEAPELELNEVEALGIDPHEFVSSEVSAPEEEVPLEEVETAEPEVEALVSDEANEAPTSIELPIEVPVEVPEVPIDLLSSSDEAPMEEFNGPNGKEDSGEPAAESEPSIQESEMDPVSEGHTEPGIRPAAVVQAEDAQPILPVGPGVTQKAREYWQLAHFFKLLKGGKDFPLPSLYLDKLIGQSFCFSLEAELWARLQTPLYGFWARRDEAIRSILDPNTSKIILHPSLQESLQELGNIHQDWLWEGKLPETGIVNSLRYFLATQEILKLRPTLMDYAVILLLFGHSENIGSFAITDYLDVEGLTLEMICEMAFRMFRLSTLSAKAAGLAGEFSPESLKMLEEDIVHAFDFLLMLRRSEGQTMTERVA